MVIEGHKGLLKHLGTLDFANHLNYVDIDKFCPPNKKVY